MSGVIPIEPTLVVTTRFPVVTALLTNAASAYPANTTRAMPPSFLVSNRDWWILRWIRLHNRVTWEFNSVAFENICGGDEICCEEPRFVVDRPFLLFSAVVGERNIFLLRVINFPYF